MPKDFTEPALTLSKDGLRIASSDVSAAMEKKSLSASLITGLEGCHARWVFETFVARDLIEEQPDNAARRGSLYHKVMEDFFALPPEQRTRDELNSVANKVLQGEEFKDMLAYPEAIQWLKEAVRNYYRMGAKPPLVKVARIPEVTKDGKPYEKNGLEIFVKGNIGDTKRDILGFIDRLVVDQRRLDGALIIEDWKTGKVKRWKAHTKSTDGLGETRQQVIYSILLEQRGLLVSGARLIYPVAKEIVDVDLEDKDFKERVVADIKRTDEALDILQDSNEFAFTPGFLCAWCPLAKLCPSATIKPYKKMEDAYAQQPEPEILQRAIEVL